MKTPYNSSAELCKFLRDNSSGMYRPSAFAADYIESLEKALKSIIAIQNRCDCGDWDEIEEAREIARKVLLPE